MLILSWILSCCCFLFVLFFRGHLFFELFMHLIVHPYCPCWFLTYYKVDHCALRTADPCSPIKTVQNDTRHEVFVLILPNADLSRETLFGTVPVPTNGHHAFRVCYRFGCFNCGLLPSLRCSLHSHPMEIEQQIPLYELPRIRAHNSFQTAFTLP